MAQRAVGDSSMGSVLLLLVLVLQLLFKAHAGAPVEPFRDSKQQQQQQQQCGTPEQCGSMIAAPDSCTPALRRRLAWGVATAAYQIEGGWNQGGRTESVWDKWAHSGHVWRNQSGDTATDHYHRWREDVQLMQRLGIQHYRLSLSWNRIVPGAVQGSPANPEGVTFYRQLLEALRAAGIEPMVTLFHWDLPQQLQDEYGGFNSSRIADDFAYYSDVVFRELGALVRSWVTFNEPLVVCDLGFKAGTFPPGWQDGVAGSFRCGHNILLAHAAAVKVYRERYQASQAGKLSIAAPGWFAMPADPDSQADRDAAERMMVFKWAWFTDPLVHGDYPQALKDYFGSVLPAFTRDQKDALRGSADFIAVQVYTSRFVSPGKADDGMPWLESVTDAAGAPLGVDSDVDWLKVTPGAVGGVVRWMAQRYPGVEIKVTENGVPRPLESELPTLEASVSDAYRVAFYAGYLDGLCQAVRDGVNVTAYYAWSLLDNLEWLDGFRPRFGITFVDFEGRFGEPLTRTPKMSAWWLSQHFFRVGRGPDDNHAAIYQS